IMGTNNKESDNLLSASGVSIKEKYFNQLNSDFQLLSEIVLEQLANTQHLLTEKNEELFILMKKNEKIIDSLDITIKEKVINSIMFFNPVAIDLRKIMAYYDMTISLERVGDLIQNVAESIKKIDFSLDGFDTYIKLMGKMLVHTDGMLKNAVFSVSGSSNQMAYNTILMDDKVDKMERKMERKLAEGFQEKVTSYQMLINIVNLNNIAYYIERIGDKAVDMAESAIFLLEGKDVRHDKELKKSLPFKTEEDS
ncbi:MAG: PhoU domain-containing protein, partial [Petrimonas sp.]|nr:PhoU domain-containing protein [Petrimonas sp.]